MSGQAVSLFSISYPNYQLTTGVAAELVELAVNNGDGTYTYTVPMVEGFEWSNGDPITANDMVWTFNTVNDLGLLSNWETYYRKAVGTDESAEDYVAGIASLVAVNDYTVEITPVSYTHLTLPTTSPV